MIHVLVEVVKSIRNVAEQNNGSNMRVISDYVDSIMRMDPGTGNELLRLNFQHIAKEFNIPASAADVKGKKNGKRNKIRV